LLGGVGTLADLAHHHVSLIANDFVQHTSLLASNAEWPAAAIAAIANIKIYLTTKEVATRYGIDPRSVQRRVKEGLLPEPKYFGTRFPRWSIAELDENDRKYASVRVENVGAIAALAAKKDKAAKPKLAEKPARPRKERAAATEQRPSSHRAAHGASYRGPRDRACAAGRARPDASVILLKPYLVTISEGHLVAPVRGEPRTSRH